MKFYQFYQFLHFSNFFNFFKNQHFRDFHIGEFTASQSMISEQFATGKNSERVKLFIFEMIQSVFMF